MRLDAPARAPHSPGMDETPKPRPTLTDRALADRQERQAREAAALRANLLRRKQQQRARTAADTTPAPEFPEPAKED